MNKMLTMGEALDTAVKMHAHGYPGSAVYRADVTSYDADEWLVEVRADHFSTSLFYRVKKAVRS